VLGERPLARSCCRNCVERAAEGEEEGVGLRVDFSATELAERVPKNPLMRLKHPLVTARLRYLAELLPAVSLRYRPKRPVISALGTLAVPAL
jgi:hypothetical protein